jgi:hypothetical protein
MVFILINVFLLNLPLIISYNYHISIEKQNNFNQTTQCIRKMLQQKTRTEVRN